LKKSYKKSSKTFPNKTYKKVTDLEGAHDKFLKEATSRGAYMRQKFSRELDAAGVQ